MARSRGTPNWQQYAGAEDGGRRFQLRAVVHRIGLPTRAELQSAPRGLEAPYAYLAQMRRDMDLWGRQNHVCAAELEKARRRLVRRGLVEGAEEGALGDLADALDGRGVVEHWVCFLDPFCPKSGFPLGGLCSKDEHVKM